MLPTIRPSTIYGPISLERFAHEWIILKYGYTPFPSPLLEPRVCEAMLRDFHRERGVLYSWGDYGAWRDKVLAGFYGHAEQKYRHLGIDVYVTAGTPLCVDDCAEVVRIDNDHPEPQGWGPRVIVYVKKHDILLIYAHLNPKIRCRQGETLKAGTLIGRTGTPRDNGQWFSHGHVQAVSKEGWGYYSADRLSQLDGYCTERDWPTMSRWCPNPAPYLQIP